MKMSGTALGCARANSKIMGRQTQWN